MPIRDLVLSDISKVYNGKTVVDRVNLKIEKGDFVTILGPSGAGKTTVLKMVSGFESISKGDIYMDGKNIADTPAHRRNFGMLFQNYALFPHMTVEENIAYPLKIRKMPKAERSRKVDEMLDMVEMAGFNKRFPRQLSGGQQQRVALARAIVFNPPVLLLDEPMGALDKQLRKQMQIEIKKIHNKLGLTTISVTHDQEEALTMATKVCVMRDGRIQQVDTPDGIYEKPVNTFIANFIGESTVVKAKVNRLAGRFAGCTLIKDGREFEASVAGREDWVKEGAEISLVIRPEKVKVVGEDYDGMKFNGQVIQSVYVGDTYRLVVRTTSGIDFKVKVFSRGKSITGVGSPVTIGLRPKDLVAVRD
jgi:putative spermidine/putrescine transport system ATP-binding protein